ncbi:MAG: site-specific integrase [Duncaniella sp.]|nr:site-specific integrase [Duncaniella sp.]
MVLSIYVGKRTNSRGKVELSLRFRHGKIDRQAATNLWIHPGWIWQEEYVSSRGRLARRCVLKLPEDYGGGGLTSADTREFRAAAESLQRMMAYIEDAFCIARRRVTGADWLAETIAKFHADELPRLEMERTDVLGLIDTYMEHTSGVDSSESREDAYRLMRRSLARFELYRRLKSPHFRLFAGRMDEGMLRAIERFMRREHLIVKRNPTVAQGPGLDGRTRPKGQNTVNDRMKLLKAVMSWAVKTRRISVNPFDSFVRCRNVYGTPVYLTLEERRKVERHDFSDNPRMALQRDIFVFQCCVGCRVSDLMELTVGNIINGELNYVAKKTRDGHPVTIKVPLNRTARDILERYADPDRRTLFPEVYSRMGYNRIIKDVLKCAGITRKVVVIDPLTRQSVCRHIYEVASSHMARRTFIGNIYKKFKDQGLVSELSGHSPGSNAFARYREIDTDMKREMVDSID